MATQAASGTTVASASNGSPAYDGQASPSGAAPDSAPSALTDEQILGIGTSDAGDGLEPAEDAPLPEGQPQRTSNTGRDQPKEESGDTHPIIPGEPMPKELREAISANPSLRPHIQRVWDQLQAYASTGPVGELRALRERFPGGAQQVEDILKDSLITQNVDEVFFSGTAESRAQLVRNLYESNPQAIIGTTRAALSHLEQNAPEQYTAMADSMAARAFLTGKVGATLHAMGAARQRGDTESLAPLTDQLYALIMQNAGLAPSNGDSKSMALQKREQQIAQREQQLRALQETGLQSDISHNVMATVYGEVRSMMSRLAQNAPVSDEAREIITDRIIDRVSDQIAKDRAFQWQLNNLSSGQYDAEIQQQIAGLAAQRIRQAIPPIARDVFHQWTNHILTQNKAMIGRKLSAASRRDIVGGGAGPERGQRRVSSKDIDYRKMSDEQILSM